MPPSLASVREPLDPDRLAAAWARTGGPWLTPVVHPALASTNAEALRVARPWAVVVTDHQTGGRGRLSRGWQTPEHTAVTVSLTVPMPDEPLAWGWLPLLVGVAVHDAVAAATGLETTLKWPNDVLVPGEDERKLCGILCEVAPTAPLVVVGIGLNVDQDRAELPVATATSLRLCGVPGTAGAVRREALLAALGDALAEVVSAWSSAGDAGLAVQQRYRSLSATLGRSVRVVLPGAADLVGTAETVDEHGRVVVRGLDGQAHPVAAGDVVHLRHTGSASPADATLT